MKVIASGETSNRPEPLQFSGLPATSVAAGPTRGVQKPRTKWTLFHTNRTAWAAAKELLDGARESIAIEQFIFSHRGIGAEILEILTRKASSGVRVRVIADAFGSPGLLRSEAAQALLRAGGEIAIYHGLASSLRHPASAFHRMHRKTIVCDGRYFMTGGSCFHPRMEEWRDTMVTVEGPVARAALHEFEKTWARVTRSALAIDPAPVPEDHDTDWSYMVSSPYGPEGRKYYLKLLERISEAQRMVVLTTPYLVPVGRFWTAMERATRRGVHVRVMIPRRSDHALVDLFSLSFARRLLGQGVEVYGYTGGMMHAKLAVIDDDWAAVGSFNLGIDSIRMNVEGVVVSRAPDFHDALLDQLEQDLKRSRRL
jgi:cardiolipin synthase A/B